MARQMTLQNHVEPAPGAIATAVERHPYAAAFGIFLVSRFVIFMSIKFSGSIRPPRMTLWQVGEAWYHRLLLFDSGWYLSIARDGYILNGGMDVQSNLAFPPLFPLLTRGLAEISGLRIIDAMLAISNVASFVCVALLVAIVRPLHGARIAVIAVALLSFLPSSVFLSAGYSEPLALALCMASLLSLMKGRHFLAALCCAFATVTRTAAVALLPVIMIRFVLTTKPFTTRGFLKTVALASVAVSGMAVFMTYQWLVFHDPLLLVKLQEAWSGPNWIQRLLNAILLKPLFQRPSDDWYLTIGFAALIAMGARRIAWPLTLYAAFALLIPYLTVAGGRVGLISMPRYYLLAFPVLMTGAILLDRRPKMTGLVIAVLAASLAITTADFVNLRFVG